MADRPENPPTVVNIHQQFSGEYDPDRVARIFQETLDDIAARSRAQIPIAPPTISLPLDPDTARPIRGARAYAGPAITGTTIVFGIFLILAFLAILQLRARVEVLEDRVGVVAR